MITSCLHAKRLKSHGFSIVELLIVIVALAILTGLVVAGFNGISARAESTSMSADLTSAHKLVESYQAINGSLPTSIGQLNGGAGFTPSVDSSIQLSSTNTPSPSYCITVERNDKYMKYDSAVGNNSEGFCTGHGPTEPAQVVYFSGINSYPAGDTTYPLTPGVALQDGDVIISFHTEHYYLGAAALKVNGVNQTAAISKVLDLGSSVYRATVATNITASSTLTFTTDGSGVSMAYYVVRGVTSPTTYTFQQAGWGGSVLPPGSSIMVPSQSIRAGQVAVMGMHTNSSSGITFPYNPTPSGGGWVIDSVGSNSIQLAHVIGTRDTSEVAAGVYTSTNSYMGAAIFILGS